MPLEPPGTDVPPRSVARPLIAAGRVRAEPSPVEDPRSPSRFESADALQLAAAGAAAVVAGSSTGDALLLGVLLGLAAGRVAGAVGVLAGLSVLARWGSSSLGALAGAQTVLGPAALVGPVAGAAAAWCAAIALVVVVPRRSGSWRDPLTLARAAGFGLAAAAIAFGPGADGAIAARVVASLVSVVAVLVVPRFLPERHSDRAALVLAVAATALAVVA